MFENVRARVSLFSDLKRYLTAAADSVRARAPSRDRFNRYALETVVIGGLAAPTYASLGVVDSPLIASLRVGSGVAVLGLGMGVAVRQRYKDKRRRRSERVRYVDGIGMGTDK